MPCPRLTAPEPDVAVRLRKNVTIDGPSANARAHLRGIVKRILRKYGYPPEKQEKASKPACHKWSFWVGKWQHNALTSPLDAFLLRNKIQI